ncbi:MAG TPA: universal stress protein [Pyrinomonadaceae bacterium]|nr:universal stress protein [Pyrinomonadaceae bacterium]
MTSLIESVLHPTDFSEGSKVAFHHALKAALLAKSELTLLHVCTDGTSEWTDFPGVRETLERWKLLPKNSPRSAVAQLGIDARKVVARKSDPVEAVLGYLQAHPADLIVLATHQREGRVRWLDKSVAEPVARRAEELTLFIPGDSEGFVSGEDGSVSLNRILIPIAVSPRPQPSLDATVRLVTGLGCPSGTFTLVHVGQTNTMPTVNCPKVDGWEWKKELRSGNVIQTIVDTSNEINADLIVMATDGRNGFLDGLRGSHSERVLRQIRVPLLTVPVFA